MIKVWWGSLAVLLAFLWVGVALVHLPFWFCVALTIIIATTLLLFVLWNGSTLQAPGDEDGP